MPNNKLKKKIRERMAITGESYMVARLAHLAEQGLPPDHPTSAVARERSDARIAAEYGDHLGVTVSKKRPAKARNRAGLQPAPAVVVETKVGGRVVYSQPPTGPLGDIQAVTLGET